MALVTLNIKIRIRDSLGYICIICIIDYVHVSLSLYMCVYIYIYKFIYRYDFMIF